MRSHTPVTLLLDDPKQPSFLFSELNFRRRNLGMKMLFAMHDYLNVRCRQEQGNFLQDALVGLRDNEYYLFLKNELAENRAVSMFEYACFTLITEDINTLDINALESLYDYFSNQHEHVIRYNLRVQLAVRKVQNASTESDKSVLSEDLRQAFSEFDKHMSPSQSFHCGYLLNLQSAQLSCINLNSLNFRLINFMNANLSETGLYDSIFIDCCLDGADLHQDNGLLPIHNIAMVNCSAKNTKLKGGDTISLALTSCDITGAELGSTEVTVNEEFGPNAQIRHVEWEKFVKFVDLREQGYLHYLNDTSGNVFFTQSALSDPDNLTATISEIFACATSFSKELAEHMTTSLIFHIEKSDLTANAKLNLIDAAMRHPALQSGANHRSLWEVSATQSILEKARLKVTNSMFHDNQSHDYVYYIA